MFYLTMHSTHMIKKHSDIKGGNPLPPHGLLFQLAASFFLYAPSHRQDYTSCGTLVGTRNSSIGLPWGEGGGE